MILALQTTTFAAHGGIPAYNRILCRALNELCDGVTASEKRILIATDQRAPVAAEAKNFANLSLEAFGGNRLALIKRFLRLALTRKIDLALIGHVNYAPFGFILKKFQPRLRYGVFLYGIESWRSLSGLRRRALQQADFMISISEYTRARAVEANGLDAEKIHVLPNALEWNGGQPPAARTHERNAPLRLLSVCRLDRNEQYKGIDKVIEVLPELARSVTNFEYVVVGGGTDLERHKELAQRLGVADRVRFLGFVSDDALRAYYQDCDLFVMPSAGEGLGFVYLEAMKHGKAIVAANSGGAPEVVQDGVTGKLVEYGNREKLTRALTDFCLDADVRRQFGAAGYQRLQDKFSFAHFKQKLTEILKQERPEFGMADARLTPISANPNS